MPFSFYINQQILNFGDFPLKSELNITLGGAYASSICR
jgi:hypothetical protein